MGNPTSRREVAEALLLSLNRGRDNRAKLLEDFDGPKGNFSTHTYSRRFYARMGYEEDFWKTTQDEANGTTVTKTCSLRLEVYTTEDGPRTLVVGLTVQVEEDGSFSHPHADCPSWEKLSGHPGFLRQIQKVNEHAGGNLVRCMATGDETCRFILHTLGTLVYLQEQHRQAAKGALAGSHS